MKNINQNFLSRFGVLIVSVFMMLLFTIISPYFFNMRNLNVIAVGRVITGFFGLAAMIPLLAGEFDISLGYMIGFSIMVGAKVGMYTQNPALIILGIFVTALLCGCVNGFITVYLNVPSTVSTMGMGTLFYGLTLSVNGGLSITGTTPSSMISFIKTKVLGFNVSVWILVIFALLLFYVLEYTPLGKQLYAVGMNRKVTHLAGIDTKKVRFLSFVMASFFVAISATILLSQAGNAYPDTGPSYLMSGLAVVFFSTTTHYPGRFNVPGMMASLVMLGILFNGISLLGAPFYVESLVNGLVLISVVLATSFFNNRRRKSTKQA